MSWQISEISKCAKCQHSAIALALMQILDHLIVNNENEIMVYQSLLESIGQILLDSDLMSVCCSERKEYLGLAINFLNKIVMENLEFLRGSL